MRNITSLLYEFHDCREIKIYRKICKKELIKKFQRNFLRSIGFYTVQFLEKFAIDCEISKEFFAIDRFIYCSLLYIFCTVNFAIDRKKILLKFRDRSVYSLYNFWKKLRSIAKFQRSFLRSIALFTVHYCTFFVQ